MSNPVQLLLEAFNGISQCIQTQLSRYIIRSNQPSTSLNKNDNSLASLSSHSAGASYPFHPPGTRQKQKFSGLRRKKNLGGPLGRFFTLLLLSIQATEGRKRAGGHIFLDVSLQGMCGSLQKEQLPYRLDLTTNSPTGYATFIMLLIEAWASSLFHVNELMHDGGS